MVGRKLLGLHPNTPISTNISVLWNSCQRYILVEDGFFDKKEQLGQMV